MDTAAGCTPFLWGWVEQERIKEDGALFQWLLRVRRENGEEKVVEGELETLLGVEGVLDYNDVSVVMEMRPRKVQ